MKGFTARGLVGLSALTLLAGCSAFKPIAPAPAVWTHWVCDSQVKVDWRVADGAANQVEVRLAGVDPTYHLKSEADGTGGALYSDGVLAFRNQGAEGLVYWVATNDLIGRGCKAP